MHEQEDNGTGSRSISGETVDGSRRSMALAFLGALGGSALLKGCTAAESSSTSGDEPVELGEAEYAAISSSNIVRVGTIAELATATGSAEYIALVGGYYAPGDGGGGVFVWSSATKAHNGGTIVNPGGGVAAGWRRVHVDSFNVRWFGAKGDGSTDDTAAIQAAIDSADDFNADLVSSGGRAGIGVFVPPGVYIVSDQGTTRAYKLLLRSNVNIIGAGRSVFVLRSALNQNANARTLSSVSGDVLQNVTIRAIAIDGRETQQPSASNYQRAGIFIHDSQNLTITDCEIYNTADCIRLHGPFNDRSTITHNFCHSCSADIDREVIQVNGARDSIIGWNYVLDCPHSGALKMEGATGWNNLFVGNVARNVGMGFAIRTVGQGFDEPETASQIKLIGNTIIDCSGDSGAIVIFGKNILVAENTIDGAVVTGVSVLGESANVIVTNNHIRNVHHLDSTAPRYIYVEVRDNIRPAKIDISNNVIEIEPSAEPNAIGVWVNQASDAVSVTGNKIAGGAAYGVFFAAIGGETKNVTITSNQVDVKTGGVGIFLSGRIAAPAGQLRDVSVLGNHVLPITGATGTYGVQVGEDVDYLILTSNNLRRCAAASSGVLAVTNRQVANNFGTIA